MEEAQGHDILPQKIEAEPKNKRRFVIYDIDNTFLSRLKHFTDIVKAKVEIHNQVMHYAVQETKTSYFPAFLTTRPASFFLDKESDNKMPVTADPASPLVYLRNIFGYAYKNGRAEKDQIRLIGCENGMVWLVRRGKNNDETKMGEKAWSLEVSPEFDEYRMVTRDRLRQIIQDKIIAAGKYKFEEGTMVLLNLQRVDELQMSEEEKARLGEEIKQEIIKDGHEEILDKIVIDRSQHDLDIYPRDQFLSRKLTGIDRLIPLLKGLGYGGVDYSEMVLAEDSINSSKKAAQLIVAKGGKLIVPANAQTQLKSFVRKFGGVVSQYETFWGTLAAVYEIYTKVRPTVNILEAKN
ncbi:MAG: hypothetical protein M1120_03610 [Patescibacteria group bacterium]|nr:hypothetical protein [Patescibacteria group bacterium]